MPKKARSGWIVSAEARSSNQIFAALVESDQYKSTHERPVLKIGEATDFMA